MGKLVWTLFFILLSILCLVVFLKFYETQAPERHVKERINLQADTSPKIAKETTAKKPVKVVVTERKIVYTSPKNIQKVTPQKNYHYARKNNQETVGQKQHQGGGMKNQQSYAYRSKAETVKKPEAQKPHYYSYSIAKEQPSPPPTRSYRYETKTYTYYKKPEKEKELTSEPSFANESMLKYVLFTVNYDAKMIAGETKSLELTMSPRSALSYLEKAMHEKQVQQDQIKVLEEVQSKYKYVSAELMAKNNCLQVQKRTPSEEKIYLPSLKESTADQIWRWDLIAPDTPTAKMCNLTLFIRFCLNQTDCLPMKSPDKEFNIEIAITIGQRIYKWFYNAGNIAGIAIPIITVVGCIAGYIWRRKKPEQKSDADSRRDV